ncbi:MAG: MBL fold metallo-hydrolase [Ignavibacteriaceae bacterium]
MLSIKKFIFSPFDENTYILFDDENKEAAIVDPGCYYPTEEKELDSFISEKNLKVKYLINTHCHIDHIFGCKFVKEKYSPIYYAPEKDLPLLQNVEKQASMFGININSSPPFPDEYLTSETKLFVGNSELQFIYTPGHTKGEFCIHCKEEKICITGDVLFNKGIGRTDLWGGDYNKLIESINSKLFILSDDTIIYPGHGDESTIGSEKKLNPFLI